MRNRRCKKILDNKLRCKERASQGENYCKKHLQSHNWVHTYALKGSTQIGAIGISSVKSIPKSSYQEYLDSKEWKQRADHEKQRNPKCALCNRKGMLHVHHRTYVRLGYEAEKDLVVLCDECHKMFHDNYKYAGDVGYFIRK